MEQIKRFQVIAWTLYLGDAVENVLDNQMSKRRLTLTQARVLRLLAVRPGSSPGEVARLLNRDESTTTGILKRLEARGLVRRESNEHDRRQAHIWLTEDGRGMFNYYQQEFMKLPILKAMEKVSEEDMDVVLKVFKTIAANSELIDFEDLVQRYSKILLDDGQVAISNR